MALIEGGDGPDVLADTPADDRILAMDGDDRVTVSNGRDVADGGLGLDTLAIRWGDAVEDAFINPTFRPFAHVGPSFPDATRRVDYGSFERLDVLTGSGDDVINALGNVPDTIDGGAGVDRWRDVFDDLGFGLDVRMEQVSSPEGRLFDDGTSVRRLERANLTLTDSDDLFSDFGPYDDVVYLGAGNDDASTTGGRDFLDGDAGDDTLRIDWRDAADTVRVNEGGLSLAHVGPTFSPASRRVDHQNFEHLDVRSGSGDDHLRGFYNSTDTLDGGRGADLWVDSFDALDIGLTVLMGQISGRAGAVLDDGSSVRRVERVRLDLTDGGDIFRDRGPFDDVVYGEGRADNLGTSGGRDFFDGGLGDDTLTIRWGGVSKDVSVNGAGVSNAHVGPTFTEATRRVDHQLFEHLDVRTGRGDDDIRGFYNSADTIDGGAGIDVWRDSFERIDEGITVSMMHASRGRGWGTEDGGLVRNVERAVLTLSERADSFSDAGAHDDSIIGLGGRDRFQSRNGADFFDGGEGIDTVVLRWGDARNDVKVYNAFTLSYAFEDSTGTGSFREASRSVDYQLVERFDLTLGRGDDAVFLGGGNDIVRTRGGADSIESGGGRDDLAGGNGDDTLRGEEGADLLRGGNGADLLDGGPDRDVLIGGRGPDVFVLASPGEGRDVFGDFGRGDDRIALADGLAFEALMITEIGPDARIAVAETGEALALVRDATAADLPDSVFITV